MSKALQLLEQNIVSQIYFIRGHKVMLDFDLAQLYKTETRILKQAVKRNLKRFPPDFMFQLTKKEWQELITNCDNLGTVRFSPSTPFAFTEHGTVMLATVLNSPVAVESSIFVVRAFIKLRDVLATHKELEKKISELERETKMQFKEHSEQLQLIFQTIKQLIQPEEKPRKKIGYKISGE